MAMYANGNESPTLRTYVSDETKVSFLNVSTFKSAQVPWTYFLRTNRSCMKMLVGNEEGLPGARTKQESNQPYEETEKCMVLS